MSDDRKSLPETVFSVPLCPERAENYGMIGTSAPMRALFSALPRIAASSSPLLISGERGTGKNLIARAVHTLSPRSALPCVKVDCTAAPERKARKSIYQALQSAQGGTVVLDGIDSLSIELQARLLRTLRSEEIDLLGVGQTYLDVRIISTSASDLESAVEQGRLREALYYQLNVLSIHAPPLRERGRDVQLLADFFLDMFTTPGSRRRVVGFSAEARLAMQQWGWPGNVRELVNRVRKAIIMCEKGPLYSGDLGLDGRGRGRITMTLDEARDAAELSALLTALAAADGDLAVAASNLGTTRVALCRLMRKHRIDVASPQLVVDADR